MVRESSPKKLLHLETEMQLIHLPQLLHPSPKRASQTILISPQPELF
jgi:hypothetical protein